jgi:UDP-glucose:(heptosyl)LPS alpha-1,3-glucosyltransferase
MKLAVVIFRYFPFGGLQRDMLAIAQEARRRGHQVTVFCGAWQGEKIPGIDVVIINGKGFLNVAGVSRFVKAFQQEFQRDQFDLLVGFNKMPGLDVYFCGDSCFAKKAYEERGFFYRLTPRARLYLNYEKAVYSHLSSTQILEIATDERAAFAKYYATPVERQYLLPPGVDQRLKLETVQRAAARQKIRQELALADNEKLILCVGSGFKTKGLDRSIRAFAALQQKMPSAVLAVVGNGNARAFQRLSNRLGVGSSVKFLGGRNDMAAIYAAGDLLLHPAYKEVAGNVLLEAMLCDVPVLATAVCGYAHYIETYALGELLDAPDDAIAVANQMEKVLATDAQHWLCQAEFFAGNSDIFSRPARAVDQIETIFHRGSVPSVLRLEDNIVLCDELITAWQGKDIFQLMENIQGQVAREMPDRQTLRFEFSGRTYYRKWHRGVGWWEIIKNILQLRMPVLGADNEWEALNKLRALNIPSLLPVAYGKRGISPAHQQSFIVTRELAGVVQLDHYFEQHSVAIKPRRQIIGKVARMVRALHSAGINHRDLYLCHFMLRPESVGAVTGPDIYLVDLHRAQCRALVPHRWRVKDLAALYFSTLNLDLNLRDYLFFLQCYFDRPLRAILRQDKRLLEQLQRRAIKMYRRDFGHAPGAIKFFS